MLCGAGGLLQGVMYLVVALSYGATRGRRYGGPAEAPLWQWAALLGLLLYGVIPLRTGYALIRYGNQRNREPATAEALGLAPAAQASYCARCGSRLGAPGDVCCV